MSVVLVTDHYESIRPVLDRLRVQTVREELEVVLVAPTRQALADAVDLEGFAAVRVVELGLPLALGEGRAAGVRAASAPLVYISETHTYPHPRFAQTLIEAHGGPWAVVVPGFGNANPDGSISWAGFLSDYGPWLSSLPAGEVTFAPFYNVSYRRSVLLELGDRLGDALSHGDEMLTRLRRAGHEIYFEPAARIDHVNLSRPAVFVRERYTVGLLIAAPRARRWSWRRRLVYVCGAPLLPALYLARVRAGTRAALGDAQVPSGTFAAGLVGVLAKAAGEMIGYARGSGSAAERRMLEYELHKVSYASSGRR